MITVNDVLMVRHENFRDGPRFAEEAGNEIAALEDCGFWLFS